VYIQAKCEQGSKIESAWRDAVSRNPKSQAMKIYVNYEEFDEKVDDVLEDREILSETLGSQEN
jgi:hypothetical protein